MCGDITESDSSGQFRTLVIRRSYSHSGSGAVNAHHIMQSISNVGDYGLLAGPRDFPALGVG